MPAFYFLRIPAMRRKNIEEMRMDEMDEQKKPKKPITKRWWFWVIVVVLALGVIGSAMGGGDTKETPEPDATPSESVETEAPTTNSQEEPEAPEDDLTLGQRNALDKAASYLSFTAFSYGGLIDQLEYEGFSLEEATFAADNCGADWNEQALLKAQSYLETTAFSYSGLIGQLEYEQFTTEQATYGADNCGADWNEQAAKKAQSYLDYSSFSRDGLIDQLLYEGFTQEQAEYGVSAVGY